MADTTGVLARLQAALSTYDPTWDVSVGSATYKILESVANEIANANNNSTLQTYSYDINTKSGNDLDTFCNLFGVYRQLGKRAVGLVTFSTGTTPTTNIINIPIGTQVAVPVSSSYTTPIYYSTTAPAIIPIGSSTVSVPVLASLPGIYGNVPGNTVTALATSLVGITSVTNLSPMTSGADPESDSQLRARWQATAFNNTTGTNGKYIVTAYQDPNVTVANAFGAQNFYDEQLSIQATISGGSSGVTFQLVAYSGMTNIITGNTYSGTTVVAYSGFPSTATGSVVASGLQALVSGVNPFGYIGVSATPSSNTIASGLNISFGGPSPYRLTIGSGSALSTTPIAASGVTISGANYTEYVMSLNPDIGASGTQSYNGTYSGFVYPQGNELVGTNLNSASEAVYAPFSDYYYNNSGTYTVSGTYSPQLYLEIANPSDAPELYIGNTVEVISEYNPASSRVTTAASGNFVDIFVNGTTATTATEQTVFNLNNALTPNNPVTYLNSTNYVLGNGQVAATNPAVSGAIYIPFDRQPLINFPSQVSTAVSGMADMIVLYNDVISSGVTYGICQNPYPYITFTGTAVPVPYTYTDASGNTISGQTVSGVNFLNVNNANNFLYPGLCLQNDGVVLSGQPYHIMQVTSSGVMLNQMVNNSGTVTLSGKALAYPVYDITNNANSVKSMTGLAMDPTTPPSAYNGWPSLPASGNSWILYSHDYNADVVDVEGLVQQSRPLGVNTLVHQASFQNLLIDVRIVFTPGYSLSTAQANITNQLTQYFNNFNYLGIISFASLQSQILGVAGVANVRVTGVSTVALDGTIINSYSSDFVLASNQLPLLYNVVYNITGASTF